MYHKILLEFLNYYECDPKLLLYIIACKGELQERKKNVKKIINLETSIKFNEDGKISKGRYVITISLEELLNYDRELVNEMFLFLGFDFNSFDFENKKKIVDYVYLGVDSKKGKIYLGNYNSGICFESIGKIKFYKYNEKDIVYIYSDKEEKNLESIHIRINNNNLINWYGLSKNFITVYYRPNLNYYYLDKKLIDENNKWFYHKCDCKKCINNNYGGKSLENIINIIDKMNSWYVIKLIYIIYKIIEIITINNQ